MIIDFSKYEDVYALQEDITKQTILESIQLLKNDLKGIPVYSLDPKEDRVKIDELVEAMYKVIDWYSVPKDEE